MVCRVFVSPSPRSSLSWWNEKYSAYVIDNDIFSGKMIFHWMGVPSPTPENVLKPKFSWWFIVDTLRVLKAIKIILRFGTAEMCLAYLNNRLLRWEGAPLKLQFAFCSRRAFAVIFTSRWALHEKKFIEKKFTKQESRKEKAIKSWFRINWCRKQENSQEPREQRTTQFLFCFERLKEKKRTKKNNLWVVFAVKRREKCKRPKVSGRALRDEFMQPEIILFAL